MGQASSVPVVGRRKSYRSSWRPRLSSHSCSQKSNLSATFNILDLETKIDQLNVNIASEEELMTLPEVSRADAHSIVEYRQRLGRFKKVEDLALVTGIGADKLALIRPEICVGPRRSPSCASSRAQSTDSLSSVDVKPSPRPIPLTNINLATVFELQTIPGFTQEIAANVVDYRGTHGNFANLDQLTKVKGINHMRLGAIRSRLTVSSEQIPMAVCEGYTPNFNVIHSTPKTSPKLSSSQSSYPIPNGKISGHRKTMPVPVKLGPASNGLAVRDILDVLSACSPRPIVEDHFDGIRKGRLAVRIASWNLSGLCVEKAENPGVREVICRTILENGFSIISLQEIISNDSLEKICRELNFPTLRRIKEWKENSHRWHYQSSKGLGLVWDASDNIELLTMNVPKLNDFSDVLRAEFMVGSLHISIINVFLHESLVPDLQFNICTAILNHFPVDSKVNQILVGDFVTASKLKDCKNLIGTDYKAMLPSEVSTNSIVSNHHNADIQFYDNIYISKALYRHFTDMSGAVRQGLTHLAIPRFWSWGGPASEHCPVWCELYLERKPPSPSKTTKG